MKITLGDTADRGIRMLDVACNRCPRRGRVSVARLLAEHGRDIAMPDLLMRIAVGCPGAAPGAPLYERCGAYYERPIAERAGNAAEERSRSSWRAR